MSAETHQATLLERTGARARLRVAIVHADESVIHTEKNCALQLLWCAAHPDLAGPCPLNEAIGVENILDAAWLLANEARFIESVTIVETKNYPVPPGFDIAAARHEKRGLLPQAVLDIVVTDEKWLAHLKKHEWWDAALFDVSGYV